MNDSKNYLFKILNIQPNNTTAHKILSTMINYNENQNHLGNEKID